MSKSASAQKLSAGATRVGMLSDTRSRRSQEALRGALLRLIETRHLSEITLRDISKEAAVSYPTVFKHYPSREAIFEDIARREITLFQDYVFIPDPTYPDWRPGERICRYVLGRQALWRTLFTAGAADALRSEFIRHGREIAGGRPELGHGAPMDVVSGIIASGIFEIISWWLTRGAGYAPAEVARMLETLVIEPALNLPRGIFAGAAPPGTVSLLNSLRGAPFPPDFP